MNHESENLQGEGDTSPGMKSNVEKEPPAYSLEPTAPNQPAAYQVQTEGQPGAIGGQPGAYGGQPGAIGGQPGAYGGQPGAYGGQPGAYGGQPGAYGGQPGAVGGQPGAIGGQPGAYGGQPGAVGGQPGTYGGQPGAVGGQPGAYGGPVPYASQPGQAYAQPQQPYPGQGALLPPQPQVIIANRTIVNQWSHGLCGCFDNIGLCCMAFWCPCIVFGRNAEYLGKDCALWAALFVCADMALVPWIPGFILRSELRRKHGLAGDDCNDCLVWFCCGLCAMIQEAQEIKVNTYFFINLPHIYLKQETLVCIHSRILAAI